MHTAPRVAFGGSCLPWWNGGAFHKQVKRYGCQGKRHFCVRNVRWHHACGLLSTYGAFARLQSPHGRGSKVARAAKVLHFRI